jgi:YD repeat-containing protein
MIDTIYAKEEVKIGQTGAVRLFIIFLTTFSFSAFPGKAVEYKYDNLHRLTRIVYDNGTRITYTYDEVGNRTRRVSTLMADTSIDGSIDFKDFAILASRWLDTYCIGPEWCEGADIDWSSSVGIEDLSIIAQQWLDTTNP